MRRAGRSAFPSSATLPACGGKLAPKTKTMKTRFYRCTGSILLAAALALSSSNTFAYSYSAPNESDLDNHQTYRNHDGEPSTLPRIHAQVRPPTAPPPNAATARGASAVIAAARVRAMAASRPGAESAQPASKQINARQTAIFIEVQCRHFPRAAGDASPRTESRGFPAEA